MGLFNYFSSPDEKRKEEVRKGAVAPDRSERKRCWEARDGYNACLDKHNVIDPLTAEGKKVTASQCSAEHKVFETDCAAAWVTYFKQARLADYKKKQTIAALERENAQKVDIDDPLGPPKK